MDFHRPSSLFRILLGIDKTFSFIGRLEYFNFLNAFSLICRISGGSVQLIDDVVQSSRSGRRLGPDPEVCFFIPSLERELGAVKWVKLFWNLCPYLIAI